MRQSMLRVLQSLGATGLAVAFLLAPAVRAIAAPAGDQKPSVKTDETQTPPGGAGQRRDPGAFVGRLREHLNELELTADQKTKVDSIFEKFQSDMKAALPELQGADPQQRRTKVMEMFKGLRENIAGVLTDAQKAKFEQIMQSLRPGGGGAGGPGGGANAMGGRIKGALEKLDLNDDQKAKIKELFEDVQQKMQDLRNQGQGGDKEAMRQKAQEILGSVKERLQEILTPDQAIKLRELMEAGGGGAGDGTGPRKRPNAEK